MKKTVLSLLFLGILLSSAYAETVMLFSEEPTGIGNERDSIIYIEDGIMDVFFSAGHIIFNGGYQQFEPESAAAQSTFGDTPSFRIAKSGGADYMLQVQLEFTQDDQDSLPVKALYSFYHLNSEEKLAGGEVLLTEAGEREEMEEEVLIRRMGRHVGTRAMEGM
ncbi:MAG: hypothetical protein K9L66_01210 [Spirochaetaceae bacterium]|nr:hypothetical protein [Spirochaetaceae bacterium]MCF7947025.1 hypothetical protein [Spirochaetia bacterium]MCF7950232.1 hypothetical protein [Spirochaetaceae bacterium]